MSATASAIAVAVEGHGAAMHEIAGNVQQAALGTQEVTEVSAGVQRSSEAVGSAANGVLASAGGLAQQSDRLTEEVSGFLSRIRAA